MLRFFILYLSLVLALLLTAQSCKNKSDKNEKDLITDVSKMNEEVAKNISTIITDLADQKFTLKDSSIISFHTIAAAYYLQTQHQPLWSTEQQFTPNANLLFNYVANAAANGLYKDDYHFNKIEAIKKILETDSLKKMDALLWANTDVLLTDVYLQLLQDLKQGRLQTDSASWKNDTAKQRTYFSVNLARITNGENVNNILEAVQPTNQGYISLKKAIKTFTDSMDTKQYTYLLYPYKDSLQFLKQFKKRMGEAGFAIPSNVDSLALSIIVKKYQKLKGLTADGKIGAVVVKMLNLTDRQKFNAIAITLDKYKNLPEKMPSKYIWVNLPSYNLKVWDADSIVFESKIICGKPATPTPLITSDISDIVLYPTWTVPTSIISKDMLPGLKRNTSYLARRGLYLLNGKGEKINPASINWGKYSKGIPYRIQQGSGDGNALGVIKFNFENAYSVYLHDTNQRYLFKNAVGSLSHGCVRVQEWQKLANFIVRNDSINLKRGDSMRYNTDSIANWINQKQKHNLIVKNKMPLYIRYFACEAVNGRIKFFDDIYGEDKMLKQRFLASK